MHSAGDMPGMCTFYALHAMHVAGGASFHKKMLRLPVELTIVLCLPDLPVWIYRAVILIMLTDMAFECRHNRTI
ncbi:hypothetical protein TKWG_20290 [Advenella kashmirensis WT001]|uniref:Uncharacterized protein n=1 Tax=Advenella kashmirensis (strain DSM 17095 / LMG 22695 / WT001) TaxID=1036672 RepID=I3UFN3_ADVKW|nr:hypothetical protein TKWG_20290 [Advenella kashmirensis WT001]